MLYIFIIIISKFIHLLRHYFRSSVVMQNMKEIVLGFNKILSLSLLYRSRNEFVKSIHIYSGNLWRMNVFMVFLNGTNHKEHIKCIVTPQELFCRNDGLIGLSPYLHPSAVNFMLVWMCPVAARTDRLLSISTTGAAMLAT